MNISSKSGSFPIALVPLMVNTSTYSQQHTAEPSSSITDVSSPCRWWLLLMQHINLGIGIYAQLNLSIWPWSSQHSLCRTTARFSHWSSIFDGHGWRVPSQLWPNETISFVPNGPWSEDIQLQTLPSLQSVGEWFWHCCQLVENILHH